MRLTPNAWPILGNQFSLQLFLLNDPPLLPQHALINICEEAESYSYLIKINVHKYCMEKSLGSRHFILLKHTLLLWNANKVKKIDHIPCLNWKANGFYIW